MTLEAREILWILKDWFCRFVCFFKTNSAAMSCLPFWPKWNSCCCELGSADHPNGSL